MPSRWRKAPICCGAASRPPRSAAVTFKSRVPVANVRDDRIAIANAVRAKSYAVAAAVIGRSVRRREINVGLELTALSFADRFADAIAGGDWSILLTWVDGICEKYPDMAVIPRLLSAATSTVAGVVSELNVGLANRTSELDVVAESARGSGRERHARRDRCRPR